MADEVLDRLCVLAWSPSEIGAYIDYCRQRVRDALAGMTEEKAVALLPPAHRYKAGPTPGS